MYEPGFAAVLHLKKGHLLQQRLLAQNNFVRFHHPEVSAARRNLDFAARRGSRHG